MRQFSNREALKQEIDNNDIVFMLLSDLGCNVCLSIYPDIEELEKKYPRIDFISADPSMDQSMIGEYLVLVYPTIIVFVDGKETYRFERLMSFDDIEQKLNRLETLYFD